MKAKIESNGAILLGDCLTCDAHFNRPIRVVTHAHLDHILGLEDSINECEQVLMTSQTMDMVKIIRGNKLVNSQKIHCLQYGTPFIYGNEKITLYPAHHIIGSAQVLLNSDSRIVYTGDFRLCSNIIEADTLVIEATYGNPQRRRKFKNEVKSRLIDLIKESLKVGSVYIFGYYGKLQEALEFVHNANIGVPVVVPEKVFKMMQMCEKYGMEFGKYICSTSTEAKGLSQFIGLYHMGARQWVGKDAVKIYLSGWEFKEPVKKESETEFTVAYSDHADFDDLIEYVKLSKPKLVITDNKRVGDAVTLAQEIKKQLGIQAYPMP
ncbi:MAG: MBL fold metallo-hydrolase [bacterium]|nr:MBL fold metallo-hydrolase [bacterium]